MQIEEVRQFLKRNFSGPGVSEALRFRLKTHLEDPTLDPLSNQVWPAYNALLTLLKEPFSLLDAGCMSGFLYHHLKRRFSAFTYTGIDRWPEALEIGREFAPGVEFIRRDFVNDDLSDLGQFDYVVCSNIPFKPEEHDAAVAKLTRIGKKLIMIYPDSGITIFG